MLNLVANRFGFAEMALARETANSPGVGLMPATAYDRAITLSEYEQRRHLDG